MKVKKLYDLSKSKTRIILNSQLLVKNKLKLVRVEYEKHIHKVNQLMQITKIKDRQCQNIQSDAAYVQRKFKKWFQLFSTARAL